MNFNVIYISRFGVFSLLYTIGKETTFLPKDSLQKFGCEKLERVPLHVGHANGIHVSGASPNCIILSISQARLERYDH
jgi:hypothetical protein